MAGKWRVFSQHTAISGGLNPGMRKAGWLEAEWKQLLSKVSFWGGMGLRGAAQCSTIPFHYPF